ncbi:MAG: restriction endonuclease subunit S [Caldilinea sp.]|nr:restriction endonuclease subunit S [Caldilinea sp.]
MKGASRGWPIVAFGDVVRQVKDKVDPETSGLERYIAGEHMDTDDLRIRRWGTIDDGYLGPAFHMRFKPGQVLYGSRRTYLRKVAVPDFEGICANTTFVLEPKDPTVLLPELLPFIMQTEPFHDHSINQSKGSVNPYVNFSDLAWYEFALPPLEEQRRIVELMQRCRELGDSIIEAAASSRITLSALQKEYFFESQEGETLTVGDVADVRNGTTPSRSREAYWNGTIAWLPTAKVNERFIYHADECISDLALAECSLGMIPAGSTLIAMIGQGQTRGKAARLEIDACINQNFAAVIPKNDIDAWYLFYQLDAHYERLRSWSQGTNQHALNCSLVRDFRIRMPDISRQKEIASVLCSVEWAAQSLERRRDSQVAIYDLSREMHLAQKAE